MHILEFCKTFMYESHYTCISYGSGPKLLITDTDILICEIEEDCMKIFTKMETSLV